MRKVLGLVAAAAMGGCSTAPEDEPPVQLQPGLYEVTAGGGTLVELPSGKITDRLCLTAADATAFKSAPLVSISPGSPECSNHMPKPRGNALKGERTCLKRAMPMRIAFEGAHDRTSFRIKGTVAQGDGENASVMHLGSGDFTILGKRLGDCYLPAVNAPAWGSP